MKVLNEKLNFLLDKYSVESNIRIKDTETAVLDGKEVALLSHRLERRFIELKNVANNGTLVGISVMRVARIIEKESDIFAALYREFDIIQYVLGRKIKSVMAMENGNVLNAIATTEDGVVCTIEISATLAKDEIPKDKHEIIAQHGIACDVVVDAQLKQDSIYIFGEENKKFTDVDFELYGLSVEDIAVVRSAFALAQNNSAEENKSIAANLEKLVEMTKAALSSGERQVM